MKLLIITNNPDRASFRQRIGAYLDILRDNGINCEVAKLPNRFWGHRKFFKRTASFDGVFLHKKGLNILDAFYLRRYSRKVIYNFDDAIMYSDKNPEHDSRSHLIRFSRSVKLADMVLVGSSYLAGHEQEFNANVKILPIGLKVDDYKVGNLPKIDDRIQLVWIGSKSTLSYLALIKPALEEIGRRFDNVVLRIICDDFFDLQNMPVEKRIWSNETRAVDLAVSDIGLAPLPSNRFTEGKCSFKVLEYACVSLPVVASPVGTNSEYVRDGVTGFHASQTNEWVDRITKLVEKPELRRRMGQAGREQVGQFDMGVIGKKLCDLIIGCVGTDHAV
ncbi:MAG: glycosyltransferase family 4 protein [Planctomycetota bacterium]|jgi:glycosyltransferase involved in cell wall biosynthesis